jgi:hypothetical protein
VSALLVIEPEKVAMRPIRCLCAATLLAALTFLSPVGATSFTTDQSDLWWVPAESGWGMQFVHRGAVIFATLFVYDKSNVPTWYVATLNPASNLVWTGDLLLTSGPWLGTVPFNPNSVNFRKVGTMTWNALFIESGTVTYSVDGVSVTKNIRRQTLVVDDYHGSYFGGIHQEVIGCFDPSHNGVAQYFATLNVVQNGTNISLTSNDEGTTCTFTGTLSQAGQFGAVIGNYSCSFGEVGSFSMFEANVGYNAINARFTATSTNLGCQSSGYLGGIRQR